ncbi:MAG TPA: HD domain-containing protein [Pyrinomonadaceae bacterium]|jgi:guanosine-3',5'-bis(diphosphate) 3'-pyrophosphohydrolase
MNNLNKILHAASFAAKKHTGQTRKGDDAQPYINHPLEVANILANIGKVEDTEILTAAILHDTIEDTKTPAKDLTDLFGETVCGYVLEVTDDKSLAKEVRKQLQIEHAPHLSNGAKLIKLGDKISNITDVMNNPPAGWSKERRLEYVNWGRNVVAGLRGVNENLERHFDELTEKAEAQIKHQKS